MINVDNLVIKYGEKEIVNNFSLIVDDGEFIAITGPSGSGKSTILYTMAMLKGYSSGNLTINGFINPKLNKKDGRILLKDHIGFIFQDFLLLKEKTVKQNLELVKSADADFTIDEALVFVNMEEYQGYKVSELSGGQQQRIAIARLLVKKFNIVLADEITGNLDYENKMLILKLMKKLQKENKTIIWVTHDPEIANEADRIVTIKPL